MGLSRLFICLVLVAATAKSAIATCIVVRRTPTAIYAGADGKHRLYGPFGTLTTTRCKIVRFGNLFFAAAGVTQNAAFSYDLYQIARRAAEFSRSIEQAIAKIDDLIRKPLSDVLASARERQPEVYAQFLKFGPVHLVLFGFQRGEPVMSVRDYEVSVSSKGAIILGVNKDTSVDIASGDYVTYIGSNGAIRQLLSANPNFWLTTTSQQGIKKLIQMEIDSNSEYVGPPIEILEVTREGGRLLEGPDRCAPD